MALPTVLGQNAPYTWAALIDLNGNPLSSLPVNVVGSASGNNFGADGVTATTIPEQGIGLFNGATVDRLRSTTAGNANLNTGIGVFGPYLFNGASYDAQRNNLDLGAIITATAVTTNQTSAAQFNLNGRGVRVVLNMTNIGTGNVTLAIQCFDSAGAGYYAILTGAAISTNSVNVYTVYPGISQLANQSASQIMTRQWNVLVTANNANPTTYTVGAQVLL